MIKYPFTTKFLSSFTYTPESMPLDDNFFKDCDQAVSLYEKNVTSSDLENNLISKNELFASFAISKAENSSLTIVEAQELWDKIKSNPKYDFLTQKVTHKKIISQKDHDKVEFINIAKAFRKYNEKIYSLNEYTQDLILSIHKDLTEGLDIFADYLTDFDVYKSGKWRDNDSIRVGSYTPPGYKEIIEAVSELLEWIKVAPRSVYNIGIFHTALYALHPFDNGNKRVCRILEHMLYRTFGFNHKNLYGTSYYYHIEKERYYKNLLYSITHSNMNQFLSYSLEALAFSMLGVFKTSWEMKKHDFLESKITDPLIRKILNPLVKRSSVQFKTLAKLTGKKVSRPTLVTYLQNLTSTNILSRKEVGKNVYYSINVPSTVEQEQLTYWLSMLKNKFVYISPEFTHSIT